MAKTELEVRSAYLKTSERLPDRFLFCGKVTNSSNKNHFFFYLIEILSPWFPSSKVHKIIVSVLEKSLLLLGKDSPDKAFEDVVQKVNEELAQLSENGEKDWMGNLNAVIGLIDNACITITQTGKVSGYIFRKGKISSITESSSPNSPISTFEDITSGQITLGDRIILANAELYNHFSLDNLRRISSTKTCEQIIHDLFKNLRRIKVFGVNAIIIEADNPGETKTEENVLPGELFLDEPEESVVSALKKKLSPYAQKVKEQTKDVSRKISTQSVTAFNKGKNEWEKKYKPQTKKLLKLDNNKRPGHLDTIRKPVIKATNHYAAAPGKAKINTFPQNAISYIEKAKTSVALTQTLNTIKKLTNQFVVFLKAQNKKYLYIVAIVLLIFIGFLKIKANNSNRVEKIQIQEVADSYEEASAAFEKAKQDIALGKAEGTSELSSALALAEKAQGNKTNKEKAKVLASEIIKSLDGMTKTTRFSNLSPILTLSQNTSQIVLAGSEIYSINDEGKIFAADIRDKEASLVASIGKDNGNPTSLTYSKTPNKIYIHTSTKKLLSYEIESKTYSELKIADDSGKWEDAKSIVSFISNLYLLDSEAGEVWKHVERTGGYSRGTTYANTTQKSIRGAIDLAIDGDLYVLQNDATVSKFSRSVYDSNFTLKAIPAPNDRIDIPSQLYTDTDTTDLFILDKKLNRIVRFNKTGDYVSQYAFDDLVIEKFVLNSKLLKLWVLSKDQIYEIDI